MFGLWCRKAIMLNVSTKWDTMKKNQIEEVEQASDRADRTNTKVNELTSHHKNHLKILE